MKKNILVEKFTSLDRNSLRQITGGGHSTARPFCMITMCHNDGGNCPSPCYCDEGGFCQNL